MLETVNSPVGGRRLDDDERLELLLGGWLEELELVELEDVELNEPSELEELDSLLCEPVDEELVLSADEEDRLELMVSPLPDAELVEEPRSNRALLLELVDDSIGRSTSGPSCGGGSSAVCGSHGVGAHVQPQPGYGGYGGNGAYGGYGGYGG